MLGQQFEQSAVGAQRRGQFILPGQGRAGEVSSRSGMSPILEGRVFQAEMGQGAFPAELPQEQKLRGMQTLVCAGQVEQSHVARSSLSVQKEVVRGGFRKACWAHFWRPLDALC